MRIRGNGWGRSDLPPSPWMWEAGMRLKGERALVTGNSRGIDGGVALRLARDGAVAAVHYYRNHEAAAETLAQVRELGSDGVIVQGDVFLPDDIRRMFVELRDTFGTLDILVNSARRLVRRSRTSARCHPRQLGSGTSLMDIAVVTGRAAHASSRRRLGQPCDELS